jgi:hypothetical protein
MNYFFLGEKVAEKCGLLLEFKMENNRPIGRWKLAQYGHPGQQHASKP